MSLMCLKSSLFLLFWEYVTFHSAINSRILLWVEDVCLHESGNLRTNSLRNSLELPSGPREIPHYNVKRILTILSTIVQ